MPYKFLTLFILLLIISSQVLIGCSSTKNNAADSPTANEKSVVSDNTSPGGYSEQVNKRSVVSDMRTLHSAESTYFATLGSGSFGTLEQLGAAQMIDEALSMGYKDGYKFVVTITPATATTPAEFAITATPQEYPSNGKLSVYIDTNGQLRGADKGGLPATQNDPLIDDRKQPNN